MILKNKTILSFALILCMALYQACNVKGPIKNPAVVKIEEFISFKIDSASNHHLRLSGLEITTGEDWLTSNEFEGRSAMIMLNANICTNDDIQWNGLVTDPSGGLPFNIKLELGGDPSSEYFRAKETCAIHNGWASLVKTRDGWDVRNVNFFF